MCAQKLDHKRYSIPSRLIYGHSPSQEWQYGSHVIPPISASSAFRLESAERGAQGFQLIGETTSEDPIFVYQRMGDPNNNMLQESLAIAEQCECAVTFATGMSAIHAALAIHLKCGDEVIAHRTLYGCTSTLLSENFSRYGIKTHFVDLTRGENLESFINANTKIVYLESPANPTLDLLDLDLLSSIIGKANESRSAEGRIVSVLDNTFSTPFGQRPVLHGIDMVVHSLTKALSGFGVAMGGVVCTRKEYLRSLILARKDFGASLSPEVAWQISTYGLPTLQLRIERQQKSAMEVARYLEAHPKIECVRYPGLPSFPFYEVASRMLRDYGGNFAPGFMLYFALRGKDGEASKAGGRAVMNHIANNSYTITLAVSLGHLRTLVQHPGSMTHAAISSEDQLKRGMHPGGIRMSIGIEDPQDILSDLESALKVIE